MIRTALPFAVLIVLASYIQAADKPDQGQAAIEQKLLGEWVGGPCMGEFTFRADGTFERRNYSPGGSTLKGDWELQWKALPPSLVVKCNDSTDPQFVGWVLTVNLVRLNDEEFAYQTPGDESLMRFKRKQAAKESRKRNGMPVAEGTAAER